MKTILFMVSILVLNTCSDSKMQKDFTTLLDKELKVTRLNEKSVETLNLTLIVNKEENSVNGFSGCNRYFGSYSLNQNKISFSKIGATKMFCANAIQNETEQKFLEALSKTNTYQISKSGTIELFDENNKKLLVLTQ